MRIDDEHDTTLDEQSTGEPQTMAELLAESEREAELRPLHAGEIVEGSVSRVDGDEVLVDLGGHAAGVLSLREADGEPRPGDHVIAFVERAEGPEGHVVLSMRKARRERRWLQLRELQRTGEVVEAPIVEANRGGVVADVGMRGFVPLSQLSSVGALDRPADPAAIPDALAGMVGRRVQLKVIEADPKRNRLILSEKAAAQDIRRRRKTQAAAELHEGDVLEGTVAQVTGFGLFVDIGAAEGLVHRSEVTWDKGADPLRVHRAGDRVQVKVIDIDNERGRISLSIRQLLDDPWARIGQEIRLGDDRDGTVTRLMPFGAFVRIAEGLEGLVHVSEISDVRVADPNEALRVGDRVRVKIVGIEPERRRLSLSIRQATG